MPINYGALQPIEPSKIIGQIAPSSSGGGGGIGDIFGALAGMMGGIGKGVTPSAPSASNIPTNSPLNTSNVGSALKNGITNQFAPKQSNNNSLLQNIQKPSQNSSIFNTAMSNLGLKEGSPVLSSYLQKANPNLDPVNTPWCAGFVGSVLQASGFQSTGSLAAKSYLNFGTPIDKPSQGDIVVLNRDNDPTKGHVGFFAGYDQNNNVRILGGNQDNGVSVKSFPSSMVAGFRTPPTGQQVQQFAAQNKISSPMHLAQIPNIVNSSSNPYIMSAINGAKTIYSDNPVMSGVAASQAILESGLAGGKPSQLASKNNNFFGIKGAGSAGSASYASREHGSNGWSKPTSKFAAYNTPEESFQAHANLMNNPRYETVRNAKSVEEAAAALQKAGYATDPTYAKQLSAIYNKYVKPVQGISSGIPMKVSGLGSENPNPITGPVGPYVPYPNPTLPKPQQMASSGRNPNIQYNNSPMNMQTPARNLTPEDQQKIMLQGGGSFAQNNGGINWGLLTGGQQNASA